MSDTPLDTGLEVKASTRMPEFLDEMVESFKEEYNDTIEDVAADDETRETFRLDSKSEARRRLIDIGLAYTNTHGLPPGFAFDPDEIADADDYTVECPECFEDDVAMLRAAGSDFDTAICLSCDARISMDRVVVQHSPLF